MKALYADLLPPAAEWAARTDPERPMAEAMFDPVWRICNLYTIFDKKRKKYVPFRPKPEQRIVIWDIYVRGIKNIIIPKARQIGFSTLLALIALDTVMWNVGAKAALVDKTKEDGIKKMNDIVRVAWDKLPEELQTQFQSPILNATEFGLTSDGDGWSRFRVEKSGRGDALTFLWVSEWGTIQFEQPKRSEEIRTGGMAAAEGNLRVIETTWKGGEGGDVWPYIEMALAKKDAEKDPGEDWYIRFFPWFVEPSYTLTGTSEIRPSIVAYLRGKEKEISALMGEPFTFTEGQSRWYDKREKEFGLFVKREYPTTLQECWEAPVEGAVYADLVAQALAEGRVYENAYVPDVEVHTLWDLGAPENFVVWYFQLIGGQVRFIDCDVKLWLTTPERVEHMKAKGYRFGRHLLPHDANQMKTSVLTYRGELIAAGLGGTTVVPVTRDINLGINRTRMLFHSFVFDSVRCAEGIKSLKAYHYDDKTHEPVHDWASHACDALKVLAEAEGNGIMPLNVNTTTPNEHLRYFDPDGLETIGSTVIGAETKTLHGSLSAGVFTRCDQDEAWLRVWEVPHVGGDYLVTLRRAGHEREPDALCCWKVEGEGRLRQVAALEDLTVEPGVLARWTSALSGYYGDAMVVPVVDETSGLLEALIAEGCHNLYTRDQPREARRVGTGKRLRKKGYEATPEAVEHGLHLLREAVREETIGVRCPWLREQLMNFIQASPDLPPTAAPGHGGGLVLAAAMAYHCERAATRMTARGRVESREEIAATVAQSGYVPQFAGDAGS